MEPPGPEYELVTRDFKGNRRAAKWQSRMLAIFCGSLLLGVPLWWQTTRVYRANLPLDAMGIWGQWSKETNFNFSLKVNLHAILSDAKQREQFNERKTEWSSQVDDRLRQLMVQPAGNHHIQTNNTIMENIIDPTIAWQTTVDLNVDLAPEQWQLDKVMQQVTEQNDKFGHYTIYIEPHPNVLQPELTFNVDRTVGIRVNNLSVDIISDILAAILFQDVLVLRNELIRANDNNAKEQMSADEMRVFPPSRNYQIMFALMNEDPSSRIVNWEIESGIGTWLGPFFKRLSPVLNATILTQVQHYATLELQPAERTSSTGETERYLTSEKLGNFINSAEWNLASVVSNDPTIHMLVYTPSPSNGRIYLLDAANTRLPLNAFLIPQWGGVVIENPSNEREAQGELELLTVDRLQPIMEIFLSQLRDLLGVRNGQPLLSKNNDWQVEYIPSKQYGVTDWELDSLLRRRLGQRVISAITTLQSLARLVTSIESMPIEDHIKTKVYDVLEHLAQVRQLLSNGDLVNGFQAATRAAELAEAAFFDHTMVAQLYFPDEHKFAVYMPLFVPIAVPIVMALLRELRGIKKRRST